MRPGGDGDGGRAESVVANVRRKKSAQRLSMPRVYGQGDIIVDMNRREFLCASGAAALASPVTLAAEKSAPTTAAAKFGFASEPVLVNPSGRE
jgi:arylamine N-acetyltransferase